MKGQVVGPLQFGGMNLTIDGGCTIKYVYTCMAALHGKMLHYR